MTRTYLPGFLHPVHSTGSRKGPAQNPRPTEDEIIAQRAAIYEELTQRLSAQQAYETDPTGTVESLDRLLAFVAGI